MGRNTKLAIAAAVAVIAVVVVWKTTRSKGDEPAEQATSETATASRASAAARLEPVATLPEQQMLYEDDPVGDQRLEGQVIDADENPVGGATVVIDSNPRREVVTEDDGSFVFDALVRRPYRIEARAGDRIAGPVRALVTDALEPVVLRLRDAASLELTVVDATTDQPIDGALVELRGLAVVASTTGSDGVATIAGVGAGTLTLKISATGYASRFELVTSAGAPGDVVRRRYAMRPGVAVSGTVVDTAGRPVEGARVLFENISFLGELSDPRLDAMVTDAKGRWRFDALPRATVRFRAAHPQFAPTVSIPVPLADGVGRTGVTITLDAGARLSGQVVDGAGAPVASALVNVGGATVESALIRRAHCDADGRFELTGLPRTSLHVVAMSENASSKLIAVDMTGRREREVVVTLEGRHRIVGVVVDSSGDIVPEARVVARPEISAQVTAQSELRLRGASSVVADGAGAFTISALQPGTYRLRAIRPDTPSAVLDMKQGISVASDATGVEVVVDDLTTATGVVSFSDGSHPERFSVSLGSSTPQSFFDTDGKFTLVDVPTGERFLSVVGPELVTTFVEKVQLEAGDNDVGTISVQRGRTIRGRVLDDTGAPVAGATVDAGQQLQGSGHQIAAFWEETDGTKRVVSDANGNYAFAGIGPTPIVVVADHMDVGRSLGVALPASTDDVEVDLRLMPTGSMQGRISVNGKPAEGGVGMRPKHGSDIQLFVTAGPDGRYRYDRLAPGDYVAFAWFQRGTEVSGGAGKTIPVTIVSGQTETVDIDFPVGDLTVTVRMTSDNDAVEFGYGTLVGADVLTEPRTLTINEARAMMAGMDPDIVIVEGVIVENRSIVFENLVPGGYTACVAAIDGDPRDPEALKSYEKNMVEQVMYCQPATLTAEPKAQEVVVHVQPNQ